jgi:hypothetical protein
MIEPSVLISETPNKHFFGLRQILALLRTLQSCPDFPSSFSSDVVPAIRSSKNFWTLGTGNSSLATFFDKKAGSLVILNGILLNSKKPRCVMRVPMFFDYLPLMKCLG